jgi:hypothetical protein
MKKEDLDALAGLYEGVYLPKSNSDYLTESSHLEEQGTRTGSNSNIWRPTPSAQGSRRGAAPVPTAARPAAEPFKSRFAGNRDAAIARARQIKGSPVVGSKPTSSPLTSGSSSSSVKPTATSSAKVAPSSAKPATPAKPAGSAMDQWAAANPKLAAAKAERDRTRGTSATTNPLMKDFKDRLPAPKSPSPTTSTTAFAKSTPALASSAPAVQSAGTAASTKPTTNQTSTAFSSQSLTAKPTPSTSPIKKPGAIMSSFQWGTKATLKDVASAYASIYEAKKKDQDKDGDNDFADVRIARMIASGMSKAEAIAAVKNKPYNEEVELDEATRMRKELGKGGETATRKELAARSKAHNRSGSVDKTIAAAERAADWTRDEKKAKTLRGLASSRRKSVRGEGGLRGYAAKVSGSDKDLQSARGSARSAGTLTPKEKKQLGEEYSVYEIVVSYLLENSFAESLNDANVIIENMSEVWLNEILNGN